MDYIRILQNKVFRLLFTSIILTNLANRISSISLIWIAYNKFNSKNSYIYLMHFDFFIKSLKKRLERLF